MLRPLSSSMAHAPMYCTLFVSRMAASLKSGRGIKVIRSETELCGIHECVSIAELSMPCVTEPWEDPNMEKELSYDATRHDRSMGTTIC